MVGVEATSLIFILASAIPDLFWRIYMAHLHLCKLQGNGNGHQKRENWWSGPCCSNEQIQSFKKFFLFLLPSVMGLRPLGIQIKKLGYITGSVFFPRHWITACVFSDLRRWFFFYDFYLSSWPYFLLSSIFYLPWKPSYFFMRISELFISL